MLFTAILTCVLLAESSATNINQHISHIWPRVGSVWGGTRVTLYGVGFSEDQFSFGAGNEHKGNKVTFTTTDGNSFNCPVELDHQSNEYQIVCDTPSHLPHDEYFYVSANIDGVDVPEERLCPDNPDLCAFRPHYWWTPTVTAFSQQTFSTATDAFVTAWGKIATTRFGSNTDTSPNGVEDTITRVYRGGNNCDLQDEAGTFYDLALENDDSYNGRMTCKLTGTYVGYSNFSFMVSGPYGRSKTNSNLYHVSPLSKIYTIQTYSEVTNISPNTGSTEGGTVITIYGYNFENAGPLSTYAPFRVDVGGEPCTVITVVPDEYATCVTPAQPSGSEFRGGRGLMVDYWSSGSYADNEAIYAAVSPTGSMFFDNTSFCGSLASNYTRMSMFLKAPSTGKYSFRMKASGGGALFLDGTKVVTSTGGWASSAKIDLVKDTYYKLIAVASPSSDSSACVEVTFRYFNTLLLNSMTGRVTQESQKVSLVSPTVTEEWSLKLSAFSSQASVNEKQTVCPSGKATGRLGYYGVYTLNEVDFSEATEVANALSALPFVESGESFACTPNSADSTCLDCTFTSKRGNIPKMATNTDGLSLNVTEVTDGVPDNTVFSLMYGGVPSSLATYDESDTSAFANILKEKLEDVFSVRCPSAFNAPTGSVYQGYETGSFGEKAVTDIIPFCGRTSYKNPSDVFPVPGVNKDELSLGLYQWLCLAMKGLLNSNVYVNYETPSGRKRNGRRFTISSKSVPESEGGWKYGCINLLNEIVSENSNEEGNMYKIKRVYLTNTAGVDFYIDEVMFGQTSLIQSMTDLTGIRLGPGSPNPTETVLVDEVTVAYNNSLAQFNVIIKPHNCGSKFDLLTLSNADLSGSKAFPATSVTSTLTGGTGKAVVSSSSRATPALKGTFRLAFEGTSSYTSNIDVQNTDAEIKSTIEASSNIGIVTVESSSSSTCANRDIYLTYESMAGDRPLATLTSSLSEPSGATASIIARWDGFLEVGPIMGDYTRTVKDSPQVEVYVNNVISKCEDGVDCTFTYSSAATPTLTGQSITSGSSGSTLTLDGTLLSASVTVTIGDVACGDVSGSATSISCTVGDGPIGQYDIIVDVPGRGIASGSLKFNYTSGLTAISPSEGSLGGGIKLTLTGYGFSDDSEAFVNEVDCPIVDLEIPSKIICVVPPFSTLTTAKDEDVDVTVKRDGEVMGAAQTFTYKPSLTTTITSLTYTNPLKVSGGETITIGGTNFGSNPTVKISDTDLTIDSSSATSIVASTPVLSPGQDQALIIDFGNGASLYNDAVPEVDVTLRVDNVYPLSGSLLGGTTVTATGVGFGTVANDVMIKFGEIPCEIDTISNTQIVCDIVETGKYHYISNEGTNGYGVYFAFNVTSLKIKVGDRVKWTWTFGEGINNVQQGIYETSDLGSETVLADGINSGAAVREGKFEWQFTKEGTYNIWSGPADSHGIKSFRMTIEVQDRTSSSGPMSLTVKGHEAMHNINGASDPSPSGCALMTSDIDGCTPDTVTHTDSSKFNFVYANCRTPTVTGLTFNNASSNPRSVIGSTQLTITGTGFSDANKCTNEVKIGDCDCIVTVNSETSFTCNVDSNCDYPIGQYQSVSLDVIGYGFAQIDIRSYVDSSVVFVPEIEAITPSSGSSRGGTVITIQGSGLAGATLVKINDISAIFSESSGDLIVTTPPYPGSLLNVGVDVEVYVGAFPSTCSISGGSCKFTYSSANTPTVTAVDEDGVDGLTTLVFTGTNFGDVVGDVTVSIGGETCTVSAVSSTSLTCQVSAIPHGTYTPEVIINGKGSASVSSSIDVTGLKTVTGVNPATGSTHGGTELTFTGHGFHGTTTVSVGNVEICVDVTVSLTQLTCTTISHTAGQVDMVIESNGGSYPSISFTFESASTPSISSVSPSTAASGDSLTISGSGFGTVMSSVTVYLGEYECDVTSVTDTSIVCTLGTQTSGDYDLKVLVDGKGFSDAELVSYQIAATGIDPATGTELGNQLLTISGSGFTDQVIAKVCDNVCVASTISAASYECITPAKTGATENCLVTVQDGAGATQISAGTYVYTDFTVPEITGISPSSGGTGGGTQLTITGTSLSGTSVSVSINGVACVVASSSATEITCRTGAHTGTVSAPVIATIDNVRAVGTPNFDYRDAWSSAATWGGGPLPVEEDFVVIPSGQTIMLDQDTPILSMLLIQGVLTFDSSVADLTLNARNILIIDGGKLQAGTEAEPYEGDLEIVLHGHTRQTNLPIYGTKNIAVREGTLDLHGKVIPTTWTRLESTAAAGSNQLTVQDALDGWNVGDNVVIATTGDRHSQRETETRTISAISADKRTLTFTEALEYEHKANQYSCVNEGGSLSRDLSGEVGLLTRNIVVRGNDDPEWNDQIEACPDGFDTGEFKTQTCFQGRFGDDVASSQFGVQIIMHAVERDTQKVIGRLSYIEVTFAGQAFLLGRYPIHFHLNGDMSQSYVKGCAIHKTFNRAINIHGSHNIKIEDNVGYNIMGGAFFLEDGIETGNIYDHNLLVFVRQSTSLLNDDITPAAFWVTNPNNTYRDNAAVGGSHFGWWYRMHARPDGPSFDPNICPQKVPLGEFSNNTVHSCGWFGLWVFEDFYPMEGGGCNSNTPKAAVFNDFTVWNCEKGTEFVNAGYLVMNRSVLVNNDKAGFEWKQAMNSNCMGPNIIDSCISGKISASDPVETNVGVKLPYGHCFWMKNVAIENVPIGFQYTEIQGTCSIFCGGFPSFYEGITHSNGVTKDIDMRWVHEGTLDDKDGSLCGTSSRCQIIQNPGTHIPSSMQCSSCSITTQGLNAVAVLPTVDLIRVAINNMVPTSTAAKNISFANQYGFTLMYFNDKRLTHKNGWMGVLVGGEVYRMTVVGAEQMTNISFSAGLYGLEDGVCLIWCLKVYEKPDRTTIDGSTWKEDNDTFTCSTPNVKTGDWYYDQYDGANWVCLAFIGESSRRKRRGIGLGSNDIGVNVQVQKCFYDNCIPPLGENDPPVTERPDDYVLWNNTGIWSVANGVYISNRNGGGNATQLPTANSDVIISRDDRGGRDWVVIENFKPPALGTVLVEGGLEIDYMTNYDYTFEAKHIIIFGGHFVVGWPEDPIIGTASITLSGDMNSDWYTDVSGFTISNKALGVFGGLDLHGPDVGDTWARLGSTATAGSRVLTLEDGTDISGWESGDTVIVTTTSPNAAETEEKVISSVDSSARTVTLTTDLTYDHFAVTETIDGVDHVFAAAVGLLSRRIIIQGEDIERWGGRILVSVGQKEGDNIARSGFIRATNVEFRHMGQEGFTEARDPRYAIAVVASSKTEAKPTNITKCSFHHLHNSAIGVYGSENIPITDNVVYQPVGNGIVGEDSKSMVVEGNLVSNQQWTGSAYGRNEAENIRYEGNFMIMKCENLSFKHNFAVGSQRIGFRVGGEECGTTPSKFHDNFAVGNLMGVGCFKDDDLEGATCTRWSGFTTWNNVDYGIYFNNPNEFEGENNTVAHETTGMFVFIFGPSALSQFCSDKEAKITRSTFIGSLSGHSCTSYTNPSGVYISTSSHCRGPKSAAGSRIGAVASIFSGGPNNSPLKPCANIMSYNALCGRSLLSDNTFVNFGPHSSCGDSFALAASPSNDDANHPVLISSSTVINVDNQHLVLIPRPNKNKINPSDCVDMDCDGLKKALFEDTDGTFSGSPATWISHSEWQWSDSEQTGSRGLGDYRIPKAMLTGPGGNRLDPDSVASNGRGIIRDNTCTLLSVENTASYKCASTDYEMLLIESLDGDTEMRRLSPVAIESGGYLDLINGPQDHGWCAGYTCQKRVSTFIAVVKAGDDVTIFLTSTEPEKIRFFLIHADPSSCIRVAFYYVNPNRIDSFINDGGTYVVPANGEMKDGVFSFKFDSSIDYKPNCSSPSGTNYIDRDARMVYFILKGGDKIRLVRAKVVVMSISLQAMTETDFFGSNIIENLASMLNIPLNKIRIVSIVSETVLGRRKRSTGNSLTVTVEAGEPPAATADETATGAMTETGTVIVDACQTDIDASLGTTGASCNNVSVGDMVYTTAVPSELRFEQPLVPQHEGVPFATQPMIRAYDSDNQVVPSLGIDEHAWEITATIRSGTGHSNAMLGGTTTITAVGGWFNFTDLVISHAGSGYIIDFDITAPAAAVAKNLSLPSATFDLNSVPMSAGLYAITAGNIIQNSTFSLTLDLRDSTTDERITNITWRGHTFTSTCDLAYIPDASGVIFTGTLTQTFDNTTGTAVYNNLIYTGWGFISMACQIESSPSPAEFSFTFYQGLNVLSQQQASIVVERTSIVVVRFLEDFLLVIPTEAGQMQLLTATLYRLFENREDIRITGTPTIQSGSIIVTFTIEGSSSSIEVMQSELCSNLSSGLEVTVGTTTLTLDTFMTVDGADYYSTCGTTSSDDDDDDLHPAIIALIVAVCVLVLIIIGLLLLWKFKILPKTKTHGGLKLHVREYPDNGRTVFLGGPQQKVEDIFYKQKNRPEMRPPSSMAAPVTTLYDELDINNVTTRTSPLSQEGLYKEDTMTRPGN